MYLNIKNMKPFNIKEYNDNPSRKVVTREGRPVRILCTNARRNYPVIALIEDEEDYLYDYLPDGTLYGGTEQNDLFFVPIKREGFINLYKDICGGISTDTTVFSTKEQAQASKKYENYLDTIKIEWEE